MIIKYNAWDKFKKKMILWKDMIKDKESEKLIPEILLNSERYIPLLYIGLNDCNGEELFLGDNYINKYCFTSQGVHTIFFEYGAFTGGKKIKNSAPLGWETYEDDNGYTGDLTQMSSDWIKKVGNIYEGLKIDL